MERGDVFADPGFRDAVREMAALGLRVTAQPHADSVPFGVRPGRAGARWFVLPLRPRAVSRAALALIQPLRRAPRVLRNASARALGAGLAPILLRHRVHVSGPNDLAGVFGCGELRCAFMTGTAGPHRKLVVQCMDRDGGILGYAKVSRVPAVHALLANEAATLQTLRDAGLQRVLLPRVLRHAAHGGTAMLVTDTVAGAARPRPFHLQAMHLAFLDELAARTSPITGDALLGLWRAQLHGVAGRLSTAWRVRLAAALRTLAPQAALIAPRGWAHGDFTPVNCFPHGDRLFVFDWEYAGGAYPADFDLIRFLDAATGAQRPGADRPAAILHELTHGLGRSAGEARARLLAYACACALRGALRQPADDSAPVQWASQPDDAAMLDATRVRMRVAGGPVADQPRDWPPAAEARLRHPSEVA